MTLALNIVLIVAAALNALADEVERRSPATAYGLRVAADSLRNTK